MHREKIWIEGEKEVVEDEEETPRLFVRAIPLDLTDEDQLYEFFQGMWSPLLLLFFL